MLLEVCLLIRPGAEDFMLPETSNLEIVCKNIVKMWDRWT